MANTSGATPQRRLIKELETYSKDPNPCLESLGPIDEQNLFHWQATMYGTVGTAYQGGRFNLDIVIPDNYPMAPPTIKFITPIVHPNIHFKTGEICLDLLKSSWSGAYTISETLSSISQLLTSAEPDSPLNVDVAQLYRADDQIGAESLIRFWVARAAVPR